MHEALGCDPFVAQRAQKPAAVHRGLGELAVVEQTLAGVGGVGEPVHERRQQDRLQLGLARGALHQRGKVVERARRVTVAKGGQLRLDRVRGEGGLADGHIRHRAEQRAVEEALVQVGDVAPHALQLAVERLIGGASVVGSETGGAGQPAVALFVVRLGQLVGALETLQLQAVLQQAEEFVGLLEHPRVFAPHVPRLCQRRQRLERVAGAQRVVDAPVHELEQLHSKLHVAQTPGSELELPAPHVRRHVLEHAAPHGLDVLHERLPLGCLPHQWGDRLGVGAAELHRPGHRPRLQQRLELPGLGPFTVVRPVRIQRAHQRARCAFRTQVRVHVKEAGGPEAHHLRGHTGDLRRRGLGHEHHVHVGDVVQLPRAALAHGNDGELRVQILLAVDGPHRHSQRGRERRVRQPRQSLGGVAVPHRLTFAVALDRSERARQVGGGDTRDEAAVRVPQPLLGRTSVALPRPVQPRPVRVHADRGEHGAVELVVARHVLEQQAPLLRVRDQVVRQRGGAAQQREQPGAKDRVVGQRLHELVPASTERVVEAAGVVQREVRVAGAGEGVERSVVEKRKLLEVLRRARVRQAELGGRNHRSIPVSISHGVIWAV